MVSHPSPLDTRASRPCVVGLRVCACRRQCLPPQPVPLALRARQLTHQGYLAKERARWVGGGWVLRAWSTTQHHNSTTIQHACLHHNAAHAAHGSLHRLRNRDLSSAQVPDLSSAQGTVSAMDLASVSPCATVSPAASIMTVAPGSDSSFRGPQEQAPSEPPQIAQELWDRMTHEQQHQYQVSPNPLCARLPRPSCILPRLPTFSCLPGWQGTRTGAHQEYLSLEQAQVKEWKSQRMHDQAPVRHALYVIIFSCACCARGRMRAPERVAARRIGWG